MNFSVTIPVKNMARANVNDKVHKRERAISELAKTINDQNSAPDGQNRAKTRPQP